MQKSVKLYSPNLSTQHYSISAPAVPQADGDPRPFPDPDLPDNHAEDPQAIFLETEHLEVAGVSIPTDTGTGDRLMAERTGDSTLIVLLDGEGHGEISSPGASYLYRTIRNEAFGGTTDPAVLLKTAYEAAHAKTIRATASIAAIEAGTIMLASAGAPATYLFDSCGGVRVLQADGPALGIGCGIIAEYKVITERLNAGETMVMLSDGIIEAGEFTHGQWFPVSKFGELLDCNLSIQANLARCISEVIGWAPPHDDQTLILARLSEPGLIQRIAGPERRKRHPPARGFCCEDSPEAAAQVLYGVTVCA